MRYEPLDKFLEEHNARRLWEAKLELILIQGYSINGRHVIVTRYADEHGWEAYVPVWGENSVSLTLAALEHYVGGVGFYVKPEVPEVTPYPCACDAASDGDPCVACNNGMHDACPCSCRPTL